MNYGKQKLGENSAICIFAISSTAAFVPQNFGLRVYYYLGHDN